MGQLTRLLPSSTISSILNDASLEPVLETILMELCRQDSIRNIRDAVLINSGKTLRFVYTNDEIKDVDLPRTVQSISIQKQGDTNIMTIRGNDGSIIIFTVDCNFITYDVAPADDTVTVTTEGDERNVIFKVKANIPDSQNETEVINLNPTLEPNTTKTIGSVNGVNLQVTIPYFVINDGGCAKLKFVNSLPNNPDSNTIYFLPVAQQ